MRYQAIINSIDRGTLAPVYLIYGEEEYLQEMLVKALQEKLVGSGIGAFNYDEIDGSKVETEEIAERAATFPLCAEKRLVVVKEPVFLAAGKREAGKQDKLLCEYLENPSISTCLVFWMKGSIDKRRKIVKLAEKAGALVEISSLKGKSLSDWIQQEAKLLGKRLEPKALEHLILNSGYGLRFLKNELEKLALFMGNERTITYTAAEQVMTRTSESNIFNLVDNIGQKKIEKALLELRRILDNGEPAVKVLFMITRQFRLILQAKEQKMKGLSEKQITAELGLHPFVTGKVLRQAENFSFTELEEIMELLLKKDVDLKSGINAAVAIEGFIVDRR